jgi:hypothetical protein
MNTPPYTVIKMYRGKYQVLDANGAALLSHYVSEHVARRTVTEYRLQDKAMKHPKLLQMAESLTTLKGDQLQDWLWQVLIHCDAGLMRLLMQKPSKLKEMKAEWDRQRQKSADEMEALRRQTNF